MRKDGSFGVCFVKIRPGIRKFLTKNFSIIFYTCNSFGCRPPLTSGAAIDSYASEENLQFLLDFDKKWCIWKLFLKKLSFYTYFQRKCNVTCLREEETLAVFSREMPLYNFCFCVDIRYQWISLENVDLCGYYCAKFKLIKINLEIKTRDSSVTL